jgi:hypothetical protein
MLIVCRIWIKTANFSSLFYYNEVGEKCSFKKEGINRDVE